MTASRKKMSAFPRFAVAIVVAVLGLSLAGCTERDQPEYDPGVNQQGQLRNDPTSHNPALDTPGAPNYLQYGTGKKTDRERSHDQLRR